MYFYTVMGYLERNAEIIAEINHKTSSGEVILYKRKKVGANKRSTTQTFPIGSFQSDNTGMELYLAVKEYETASPRDYQLKVIVDLATITGIADGISEYVSEVPQVFGLLASKRKLAIGVLVEDFSKGGREKVTDAPYRVIPQKIRRVVPTADDEALANMAFLVGPNRTRRLGDFDQITVGMGYENYEDAFGEIFDEIFVNPRRFTVFVDRRKHLRK